MIWPTVFEKHSSGSFQLASFKRYTKTRKLSCHFDPLLFWLIKLSELDKENRIESKFKSEILSIYGLRPGKSEVSLYSFSCTN